jgi:hypothetical protein
LVGEIDGFVPESSLPQPLDAKQVALRLEDYDFEYKKALRIQDYNDFSMARKLSEHALTLSGWQPLSRIEFSNPTERDDQESSTLKQTLPPQLPVGVQIDYHKKQNKLFVTFVNFKGLERVMKQLPEEIGQTDLAFTANRQWDEFMNYDPLTSWRSDVKERVGVLRKTEMEKFTIWRINIEQKLGLVLGNTKRYKHLSASEALRSIANGLPIDEAAAKRTAVRKRHFSDSFKETNWMEWIKERKQYKDENGIIHFV